MAKLTKILTKDELKDLTPEELINFLKDYYSSTTIANMSKKYGLNCSTNAELYEMLPKLLVDEKCPLCDSIMTIDLEKRSTKKKDFELDNYKVLKCINCSHKIMYDGQPYKCKCPTCREIEKTEIELIRAQKVQLIKDTYSLSENAYIDISELTFREKVFLGCLVWSNISEDLSTIMPLGGWSISPTNEFTAEMMNLLIKKQVIKPDICSSINAFTESENNPYPNVFYTYEVNYQLNVDPNIRESFIKDLLNFNFIIDCDPNEVLSLWQDIAMAECLQCLDWQMEKVHFNFNPGEKTFHIIEDLLTKFSVSNVYGIIYSAVSNAVRYYQESNINKKHAANCVVTKIENLRDNILYREWTPYEYSRFKDLPQTKMSQYFFNKALKIGENGFKMVPTLENLELLLKLPIE